MAFGHHLIRHIAQRMVVGYALTISTALAMAPLHYASPMGSPTWRVHTSPIRCGLSLTIPDFGIGYFEQYAAHAPHFILRKWDEVQQALPARIIIKSPVWKPAGPALWVGQLLITPGEYGIFLKRNTTLKLLAFLFQGYEANFSYQSEQGFHVIVALSPVGFQKPYSRYQQCIGNLLPFDYARVRESVFHFPEDGRELTDEDKDQLRRIVQYTAADKQIQTIKVVGYADESGRKGYNNAISQARALTVKNYLLFLGIPKKKMFVTWVGELDPVARNDTDAGRAANRRVVITLIKR